MAQLKIETGTPTPPTQEVAQAQEQWLRDGTVPAKFMEVIFSATFSTATPSEVVLTKAALPEKPMENKD